MNFAFNTFGKVSLKKGDISDEVGKTFGLGSSEEDNDSLKRLRVARIAE